ncbi:hypothetical protein ACFQ8C_36570, partial [Streptomyces sp. NPDC056503]|uniref:hypothetical protein n=1 Tax=Streptomyces sp. NPDC056503 TaxID=3345842 RepID=UPI0036843AF9
MDLRFPPTMPDTRSLSFSGHERILARGSPACWRVSDVELLRVRRSDSVTRPDVTISFSAPASTTGRTGHPLDPVLGLLGAHVA